LPVFTEEETEAKKQFYIWTSVDDSQNMNLIFCIFCHCKHATGPYISSTTFYWVFSL